MKTFECGGNTYSLDECIKGQTPLSFYDPLAQIALRPDLRDGTILCFWDTGIEGLFAQLQQLLKADQRMVKTNPYYWTEYCNDETIVSILIKSGGAVPAAGASVTVQLAENSHGASGQFSRPRAGYRGYIKELNGQGVNITAVSKAVNGAHTVTLAPLNGEVLDLTQFAQYTLLTDTLKMYTKGDNSCITGGGLVQNPPILRKGYVQTFEDKICIHQDELTHYAYDVEFKVIPGLNPLTGKKQEMWSLPAVTDAALVKIIDSRNINTLFGLRDDVTQKGVDGLVPIARKQGMFDASYDTNAGYSFKHIIFSMLRKLRKTRGCNQYIIAHDFGFEMDWSEGIAAMIRDTGTQALIYSLFGGGGEGVRNLKYFGFKDFNAFGYDFRTFRVDGFDDQRYGAFLQNFALLLPACQFRDTNNKIVPPVTYTNIAGSEPAKVKSIWVDDTRERGCRTVDVYIQDTYGTEYHCASKLGVWTKKAC